MDEPQTAQPLSVAQAPVPTEPPAHHKSVWLAAVSLGALVLAGGVVYAYFAGFISVPFLSAAPYAKNSVVQGVAVGLSKIDSAAYNISLDLHTEPRDPGAAPFLPTGDQKLMLQQLAAYIPADLKLQFNLGGESQRTGDTANAKVSASVSFSAQDSSFEAAAEFRKVDKNYYLLVSKFPGVFFVDLSGIKGKWVKITPEDISAAYGPSFGSVATVASSSAAEREKSLRQIRTLLTLADQDGVWALQGAPVVESLDGTRVYRYDLYLQPQNVPLFYEDATQTLRPGDASLSADPTLEYLKSDEGQRSLTYLADNSVFQVWADSQGIPHKLQWSVRAVPTDDVVRLKGEQVRLIIGVAFTDIGRPVVVDAPEPTISAADAEKLVFGSAITDARSKGRDARRVSDIKQIQLGLELYYSDFGHYPLAIEALAPKYLPVVPTDPETRAAYYYTRTSPGHYAIGATLETNSSALSSDGPDSYLGSGSFTTGSDATGCSGESGGHCYNVSY